MRVGDEAAVFLFWLVFDFDEKVGVSSFFLMPVRKKTFFSIFDSPARARHLVRSDTVGVNLALCGRS